MASALMRTETKLRFFRTVKEAQFPGGPKEFMLANLRQPNSSQEIIIGFNVELDGSLNHFEIIKALTKRWISSSYKFGNGQNGFLLKLMARTRFKKSNYNKIQLKTHLLI
jgi:hypothetical protein